MLDHSNSITRFASISNMNCNFVKKDFEGAKDGLCKSYVPEANKALICVGLLSIGLLLSSMAMCQSALRFYREYAFGPHGSSKVYSYMAKGLKRQVELD